MNLKEIISMLNALEDGENVHIPFNIHDDMRKLVETFGSYPRLRDVFVRLMESNKFEII